MCKRGFLIATFSMLIVLPVGCGSLAVAEVALLRPSFSLETTSTPDTTSSTAKNSKATEPSSTKGPSTTPSSTAEAPTKTRGSLENGKIAYQDVGDRGGGYDKDIYVMATDGSGQTNISNNAASNESMPVWSPDGTKIAFFTARGQGTEIY